MWKAAPLSVHHRTKVAELIYARFDPLGIDPDELLAVCRRSHASLR
jgi:hypothetical protein